MATNPDQEEFLEDDEHDEIAQRSIFSAGWFRALLVLTVLAIVVVVSLPYLLNWLEPTPPPAKTQAKSGAPAPGPAPAPPVPSTPAGAGPLAPPAKTEAPTPPAPLAKGEEPKPAPAAPAPAAPSLAERPIGTAPLPVVPAPAAPSAKPAPGAKPAPAAQAQAPKSPAPAPKRSGTAEGGSPGGYWVQVGAFLEEKNAEALAKQLRVENFQVQVSAIIRSGAPIPAPAKTSGGQNQLFITGSTPDAVNAALKGEGTAQVVKGGVQVNPPFDLEKAMSLSSSLKKDGFKVVIRQAKGAAAPQAAAGGGPTYHVVRVGDYPDRAKAQQARGELEAKGHPGFLTQGAAR